MTQQHQDSQHKMMFRLYGLITNNPSHKELAEYIPASSSAVDALKQAYTLINENKISAYTKTLSDMFEITPERKMLKAILKDPQINALPREVPNAAFAMAKVCFEFYMLAIEVDHLKKSKPDELYEKVTQLISIFLERNSVKKFPEIQIRFYEQSKTYNTIQNPKKTES